MLYIYIDIYLMIKGSYKSQIAFHNIDYPCLVLLLHLFLLDILESCS